MAAEREREARVAKKAAGKNPTEPKLLVLGEETIDPSCLETFPYAYPGRDVTVEIDTDEYTAVCPWSGLPDFGRLLVRYVPRTRILELRSFKYYLHTYRNVGIYQEHAINRLLRDVARVVRPKWMELTLDYRVRGGVHTVCRASTGRKPRDV
jgi:7-cyano-7-deazaguanine reductase